VVRKRLLALGAALLLSVLLAAPAGAAENGLVTVSPSDMHGWGFVNDNRGTGKMVFGPGRPLGEGSAELTLAASTDGFALATLNHDGTRIANITSLNYSTYTRNANAIALQLAVSNIGFTHYHRFVFEPRIQAPMAVEANQWQRWNATAPLARWWVSDSSNELTFCKQAAPCTWTDLKGHYPLATITGGVWLKAGSGWTMDPSTSANKYNVDGLHFAASSPRSNVLYDFEPSDDSEHDNGD